MIEPAENASEELVLIYDGQCPLCTAYSRAVEIEGAGDARVRRVDARSDDERLRQARAAGLDLDQGVVVIRHRTFHHGADALHLMARLAPRRGLGNRLNRLLFGSLRLARLGYPLLRAGRNGLLRLLGRSRIDPTRPRAG